MGRIRRAYPTGRCDDGYYRADEDVLHWGNSTEPYRKNPQITEFAGVPDEPGASFTVQRPGGPHPYRITVGMNGLLHTSSVSSIGAPSTVAPFWPAHDKARHTGIASSNPWLNPPNANLPCRFNPGAGPQGQTTGLQCGAM